jgi:hypothetical protein
LEDRDDPRRVVAVAAVLSLGLVLSVGVAVPAGADTAGWPMGGQNYQKTRANAAQRTVDRAEWPRTHGRSLNGRAIAIA